jgi:hypothetical protein
VNIQSAQLLAHAMSGRWRIFVTLGLVLGVLRQCSRCAPCPGIGNCGCGCHYFGTVNHAREAIDDGAVVPHFAAAAYTGG